MIPRNSESIPASGKHKGGAGTIPKNQLVAIRQVVTPNRMMLFVDGKERAKWDADFSNVNEPLTIKSAANSVVAVKQLKVRKLR